MNQKWIQSDIRYNVGKTIIYHPFGNGSYNLFMDIYGDLGDGSLLFLPTLYEIMVMG